MRVILVGPLPPGGKSFLYCATNPLGYLSYKSDDVTLASVFHNKHESKVVLPSLVNAPPSHCARTYLFLPT